MENQFQKGEIVIYTSEDGSISLDTKLENDTIWLTQKQMAELFNVKTPAIKIHTINIITIIFFIFGFILYLLVINYILFLLKLCRYL